MKQLKHLRRLLSGFRHSEGGIAAIEFAAVAPILIFMVLAISELSDGISARKRVNLATNTVADLFAQFPQITSNDAKGIFGLADATLEPKPGDDTFSANVFFVRFDDDSKQSTAWQCTKATKSCKSSGVGSPSAAIPDDLIAPNTSLVVVETTYDYTPLLSGFVSDWFKSSFSSGTITFTEHAYYRPRINNNVKCCT